MLRHEAIPTHINIILQNVGPTAYPLACSKPTNSPQRLRRRDPSLRYPRRLLPAQSFRLFYDHSLRYSDILRIGPTVRQPEHFISHGKLLYSVTELLNGPGKLDAENARSPWRNRILPFALKEIYDRTQLSDKRAKVGLEEWCAPMRFKPKALTFTRTSPLPGEGVGTLSLINRALTGPLPFLMSLVQELAGLVERYVIFSPTALIFLVIGASV
jgi:hypothetical protein